MNYARKSWIIAVISIVIFLIVVPFAVKKIFFPGFDDVMSRTSSLMNKKCPMMVDKITRLDNTVLLPGKVFQYNYTIISLDKSEIDTNQFKKGMETNIINLVKTSPELKYIREHEGILVYNYKDKNGKFIVAVYATPDKYIGD